MGLLASSGCLELSGVLIAHRSFQVLLGDGACALAPLSALIPRGVAPAQSARSHTAQTFDAHSSLPMLILSQYTLCTSVHHAAISIIGTAGPAIASI